LWKEHKLTNELVVNSLNTIAARNGGLLLPQDVVAAARNPKSPIHDLFEWDDSEAGHRYRLIQARVLIRVAVTVLPTETKDVRVRAFVSLSTDRREEGGYRATVDVMKNDASRRQMLADAFAELDSFRKKFERLRELNEVLSAIDNVLAAQKPEQLEA
jgi:hypothetical protein